MMSRARTRKLKAEREKWYTFRSTRPLLFRNVATNVRSSELDGKWVTRIIEILGKSGYSIRKLDKGSGVGGPDFEIVSKKGKPVALVIVAGVEFDPAKRNYETFIIRREYIDEINVVRLPLYLAYYVDERGRIFWARITKDWLQLPREDYDDEGEVRIENYLALEEDFGDDRWMVNELSGLAG
jgi:hypothetical protein